MRERRRRRARRLRAVDTSPAAEELEVGFGALDDVAGAVEIRGRASASRRSASSLVGLERRYSVTGVSTGSVCGLRGRTFAWHGDGRSG
jgi:hypothetical protein